MLIKTSTDFVLVLIFLTAASIEFISLISHSTKIALFPLAIINFLGFCLARIKTSASCLKNVLVISAPIPLVPPVTILDLFLRFIKELGASEEEYSSAKASPTTQAFGDFLVRTSFEGSFDDIALVLFVTEGTYLDWGTRLINERANPQNSVYREWIDLHGPEVLGDLVNWLENYLNNDSKISRDRADYLFHTALRYEFLFWESSYSLSLIHI